MSSLPGCLASGFHRIPDFLPDGLPNSWKARSPGAPKLFGLSSSSSQAAALHLGSEAPQFGRHRLCSQFPVASQISGCVLQEELGS